MVVHNISKISGEEAYNSLIQAAKRNINKNFIFLGLAIILGIPLFIYGMVVLDSQFISMGAIFLVLSIVIIVYIIILYHRVPKSIKKSNEDVLRDGITYDFQFKENSCEVVVLNSGKRKKINYPYSEFKKVFEYENVFEIRLASNEVILCLKDGFSGEKDKMIEFFKKNLSTNKKLKFVSKIKEAK